MDAMIYAIFVCGLVSPTQASCRMMSMLGAFDSPQACLQELRRDFGDAAEDGRTYLKGAGVLPGQRTQWAECEGKPTWQTVQ